VLAVKLEVGDGFELFIELFRVNSRRLSGSRFSGVYFLPSYAKTKLNFLKRSDVPYGIDLVPNESELNLGNLS